MVRRRHKGRAGTATRRLATALLALPFLYLLCALAGSLVPVNRGWVEPRRGIPVYLISNGIHTDIVMPVAAAGLNWSRLFPSRDFAQVDRRADFIAFGAGEQHVYLDTPTWWDLKPRTAWAAVSGGRQVIHVQYVSAPGARGFRQIRLRPEEYRRLWAAVRASLVLDARGLPERIDHPGYGPSDAFYKGVGKASLIHTCNSWVADQLRLAGVKTSLWPPFSRGLLWRYRRYVPVTQP